MVKKRRRFSLDFKSDVVRMVTTGGHDLKTVCREFDLREDMIQRWVKKSKDHPRTPFPGNGVQVERDVEFAQLRRELGRVREERDILEKAIAIFSERRQ